MYISFNENINAKKYKTNRLGIWLLTICLLTTFVLAFTGCSQQAENNKLSRDDWSDDVKTALNSLVDTYGENGQNHSGNEYVVFDFDNTSAIGDVNMASYYYRLESMAFNQTPDGFKQLIGSNLGKSSVKLDTKFNYKDMTDLTYNDIISAASTYYSELYTKYGPFNGDGLSEETTESLKNDDTWNKFMTSMIFLNDVAGANEVSTDKAYWLMTWGTGMTTNQVYNNAYRSHKKYSQVDSAKLSYSADISMPSGVRHVDVSQPIGIQVTENIKELYKVLDNNKIDVYVCSASAVPVIEAAIDYFGLRDNCSGMAGIDLAIDSSGHYLNQFNDKNTWYTKDGNGWKSFLSGVTQFTSGVGKVTAIKNGLLAKYGVGPIACFMDSTGDFNFCTEFSSIKLVTCFNRASLEPTDGGALIAALAIHQKETLGYDLDKANKSGDTFYVLQGRDETGKRTFRNSNKTIVAGSTEEKLFKGESNYAELKYIQDNNLSTKQVIEKLCIKSDDTSLFGYKYGFLKEYAGYHSISTSN